MNSTRLRPILFGSMKYYETEYHHRIFVSKEATDWWAISENRVYFWGTNFNWLCDMNTVYKILDYDCAIHAIRRWAHGIIAYLLTWVHHPNATIHDVDALSHYYFSLVAQHIAVSIRSIELL